jgi:hypothetical protein
MTRGPDLLAGVSTLPMVWSLSMSGPELRQSCGMHPMSEYAWRQNYLPTWINAAMWRWLVMWVSDE